MHWHLFYFRVAATRLRWSSDTLLFFQRFICSVRLRAKVQNNRLYILAYRCGIDTLRSSLGFVFCCFYLFVSLVSVLVLLPPCTFAFHWLLFYVRPSFVELGYLWLAELTKCSFSFRLLACLPACLPSLLLLLLRCQSRKDILDKETMGWRGSVRSRWGELEG